MAAPARVRERILAAAVRRLELGGFDGVTISSVADEAGVSRPTVYAHFGTRDALVSDALQDVSSRVIGSVVSAVGERESVSEFVVEAMVAARAAFRSSPALAPLVHPGRGTVIYDGSAFGIDALSLTRSFLTPLVGAPAEAGGDLDEVADLCIRMFLSVVQFDSEATRSDDALRGYLRRRLVPVLDLPGA
ncbi:MULTISPECIES: TetR/AcrR family transcriptional regulator [unclassified Rhodococcus (in: high G+C Gram-positive bacteria)]|uniref:TetR/AcrR family transcriptional regulator n=1 Tax=unclassified Rhodococcus (in: high G+C Gram-positive bacteria) TaxID=192944 RepID=UPI0005656BDD|nr:MULTISPECIES: TetR/AcrR family transcriptional regulator [unclassified Rhodococcus (in: high G+C Gram-positive bacteria)]MBY6706774.1 TetR/AcrR family transcriptional regulator [Rhodococcus sp. BP-241]